MKRLLPFILLFSFILSACGAEAAPAAEPVDVQATAEAMAFAMLTETQAAMPTFTSVPPTNTAMPLPTETQTLIPTVEIIETPTLVATATSTKDVCNQPLTSWTANDAKMTISSDIKKSTAVVSLYVLTEMGECGYMSYTLDGGTTGGTIPAGCYTALAWVKTPQRDFSAGTSFCITGGSWELVIKDGLLVLHGGCYPNC